jgi:hypothetical protein
VRAGIVLQPPDQRLEFFGFSLHSRVNFSNTLTRCSMKCLRVLKLIFCPIFVASLACVLASIDSWFRCDS